MISAINTLISNGIYTERGIARLTGVSQPQIHNVLKGARTLTVETADLLMKKMNIAVLDLISMEEAAERATRPPQIFSSAFVPRKPTRLAVRLSPPPGVLPKAG